MKKFCLQQIMMPILIFEYDNKFQYMKEDNILPITHHKGENISNNQQINQNKNKQAPSVPRRNKILKQASKLYKSPEDIYKINEKPINCHFEYALSSQKPNRRHKSKTQVANNSLIEQAPKLWGCIVPPHRETFIRKTLKNQFEKSQNLLHKGKKTKIGISKNSIEVGDHLENSSEILLKKYMTRKFHSQEKEPCLQKNHFNNPEPKLVAPASQHEFHCDCEKIQLFAKKETQKRQRERWMRGETQFIKQLKRFEQKYYKNQQKHESIGTTQPTRNNDITEPDETDELGFFFTNLRSYQLTGQQNQKSKKYNKKQNKLVEQSTLKQQWERLQNYNEEGEGQYHQPESAVGRIKQLTELIKWRGKILQKIDMKTRQIKHNYGQ